MSRARILEISQFFLGQVVVAMVIVINSVIGGFSWMKYDWVSYYSQLSDLTLSDLTLSDLTLSDLTLSDYNCIEWLLKYRADDAPIICEEIVMVMTREEITGVDICYIKRNR